MRRSVVGPVFFLTALLASAETVPQFGGPRRDFASPDTLPAGTARERLWKRALGPGTSGVVSDGKALFTMYSVPDPKKKSQGEEVVVCLDPANGKTRWEHRDPVARLKGQESFSGEPIQPQATPAVLGDRLCTLGYTGLLTGFDAATGKVAWRRDLVKDFDATPVQFGFAASPLVAGGLFVVHVGGKQAAVMAFRPGDGSVAWKSRPAEPAYASPVLMRCGDIDVVVQVTRDHVVGVDLKDGAEVWRYALPKDGLTNVPTPVVLPRQHLVISGQGALGTRLIQVEGAKVTEVWANEKVRFFYANTVFEGETLYGGFGEFFCGLDLADGKELWRERGQADATVVRAGGEALLLRGDGRLARCVLSRKGIEEKDGDDLLQGRCWTAPTLLGDILVARSDREVAAVRFLKPSRE